MIICRGFAAVFFCDCRLGEIMLTKVASRPIGLLQGRSEGTPSPSIARKHVRTPCLTLRPDLHFLALAICTVCCASHVPSAADRERARYRQPAAEAMQLLPRASSQRCCSQQRALCSPPRCSEGQAAEHVIVRADRLLSCPAEAFVSLVVAANHHRPAASPCPLHVAIGW